MTATQIDYISVFQHLPTPALIMSRDFTMLDMNIAYQRITDRTREDLVGESIFTAFPDNPAEPGTVPQNLLGDSLRRVIETGQPEVMPLQRYDVEAAGAPGTFEERYWCPMNIPLRGPDGEVTVILHVVEEVPELIRKFVEAQAASALFPPEVDEDAAEVLGVLLDAMVERLDVLALEEAQYMLLELA
jgi:PAS domain-containing protein